MQRASWKEMLTGDLHDDTESLSFKQGKVLTYIALVFEILGIIIVAICAIWIRFFPVEQNNFNPSVWIQSCPDHNYNKDKGSQEYLWLFYTAALIIPIALIMIGELDDCSFPKSSRSKHLTGGERFIEGIPKFGRLIGTFLLGILLTSLFIDYVKLLVSRPRPYILKEYPQLCTNLSAPFTTDINVVQSFPSHISAIVAYCCLFSTIYCYINKLYVKTPSLLIIASQCFLFLMTTSCIDRYNNNFSHIEDILVGLLVGIFFAIYISYHMSLILKNAHTLSHDILKMPVLPRSYHVSLIFKNAHTLSHDILKMPVLPRVSLLPTTEAVNIRRHQGSLKSPQPQSENEWRKNFY